MSTNWWIDAVLLLALIVVVVAIYKLSIREFSLVQRGTKDNNDWEQWEKTNPLYPAKTIRYAGFIPSNFFLVYLCAKFVLALVIPLLYLEFSISTAELWEPLLLGVISFFAVDMFIYFRAKSRKQQVQNSVSYFVDLLVAFLKSGLSLTNAFERAAEHGLPKNTPLAKEVNLVASEMKVGLEWQKGFEKLATRTGAQELQRLSLLMKVGHSTGAPLVKSLSDFADLLRETQSERINMLLNRKSLEALIPTLLLGMPVFLVLVFFPTGVQIYEAFSMFKTNW
ncbi:MAG: type II secretion system F family protein [Gammaproteobacteria bacterium]